MFFLLVLACRGNQGWGWGPSTSKLLGRHITSLEGLQKVSLPSPTPTVVTHNSPPSEASRTRAANAQCVGNSAGHPLPPPPTPAAWPVGWGLATTLAGILYHFVWVVNSMKWHSTSRHTVFPESRIAFQCISQFTVAVSHPFEPHAQEEELAVEALVAEGAHVGSADCWLWILLMADWVTHSRLTGVTKI